MLGKKYKLISRGVSGVLKEKKDHWGKVFYNRGGGGIALTTENHNGGREKTSTQEMCSGNIKELSISFEEGGSTTSSKRGGAFSS